MTGRLLKSTGGRLTEEGERERERERKGAERKVKAGEKKFKIQKKEKIPAEFVFWTSKRMFHCLAVKVLRIEPCNGLFVIA